MKRLDSDDFCEPTGVRTRIPAVFTVVCLVRRQLFGGPARAIVTGGQLDFNTKTSAALRHGQRYRGSRAAVPSECRADGVIRMDRRRWLSAVAGVRSLCPVHGTRSLGAAARRELVFLNPSVGPLPRQATARLQLCLSARSAISIINYEELVNVIWCVGCSHCVRDPIRRTTNCSASSFIPNRRTTQRIRRRFIRHRGR